MHTDCNIIAFPSGRAGAPGRRGPDDDGHTATIVPLPDARVAPASSAPQSRIRPDSTSSLWLALNDKRVVLHYQPQFDVRSGRMVGAEALVRLVEEDGTLIYPDRFIETVESTDLVVPFGRAVLDIALDDLARWRALGTGPDRIAINVSANQLQTDKEYIDYLDDALRSRGLGYAQVELELVERQELVPGSRGDFVLTECAARGAGITIDDFGTGYSSLMYLTRLPVSAIKLDRGLTALLPDWQRALQTVEAVLALAARFNLDVVAEGVETRAQLDCLTRAGVELAQGFGLARPMSRAALQSFTAEQVDATATMEVASSTPLTA